MSCFSVTLRLGASCAWVWRSVRSLCNVISVGPKTKKPRSTADRGSCETGRKAADCQPFAREELADFLHRAKARRGCVVVSGQHRGAHSRRETRDVNVKMAAGKWGQSPAGT